MMSGASAGDPPSKEAVRTLLDEIAPGSAVLAIESLPGSYSNHTHLVTARAASGSVFRIVVRRYAVFGNYDRGEKARREFKALELLHRNGIPVPEPLYLDETGRILGTPGIVTRFVTGVQVASPHNSMDWAHASATMAARIHSVPCSAKSRGFLLDANSEATWFLQSGQVPDYMRAHPYGVAVWQTAHDLWSNRRNGPAGLVHIDYWSGNILWDAGRIAAIVDWEEAAYGDPGIDVGYCRMDMVLSGMGRAADEFLNVYEAETGQRVANLALWELAAAVRPMFHAQTWITESPAKERFCQFIEDAMRRAGS